MTIGEKIKERRLEKGWSLRELSERMGYANHSTIARIETGKIDLPQSKIAKFAEVLGVDIAYLMGFEEMQKKNSSITDAVVRMRTDEDFLSIVETLCTLDSEKLQAVKVLLSAFSATEK